MGSAGAVRASGFWFLSMKSSPRTRPMRMFLGVGAGPRRGPIDLGNVEALRAIQPHGRGDQRSRRPGSKRLILISGSKVRVLDGPPITSATCRTSQVADAAYV